MSGAVTPEWHDRWENLMIAALDGRVEEADQRELDAHLTQCAECRATFAEYRNLFLGLRELGLCEAADAELPREFWDSLAAGIDRRVRTIDLRERAALRRGWSGVASGLVAAAIVILVLAGVYLKLPRTGGEPQAFTTPARDRVLPGEGGEPSFADPEQFALGEGGGDGGVSGEGEAWEESVAESVELVAVAAGVELDETYESLSTLPEAWDPLSVLAEAEDVFANLTPAEAEELLQTLEART